jgi:hypothetical protein
MANLSGLSSDPSCGCMRISPHFAGFWSWKGIEAGGIERDRVRNALGVQQKGVQVEVIDGIASFVVAHIICYVGLAAKHLHLFFRLDVLGTGE